MKYLLPFVVLFLVGCGPAPAPKEPSQPKEEVVEMPNEGCLVKTSTNLVTQHDVGPIINLVKEKTDMGHSGRCVVKFDIVVNGQTHHLEDEEIGLEQLESLCYYARERARKNLLLDLGGEFKTESVMTCRGKE